MPVSAETLRLLMAAGLKDAALLEVVDSIEADNKAKSRSSGAARQARYRANQKAKSVTGDVTSDASQSVTSVTVPRARVEDITSNLEIAGQEENKKDTAPAALSDLQAFRAELSELDTERLDAIVKHRRSKKGQLTSLSARLFVKDAAACGMSLSEAVDACISRGWLTVKPEYFRGRNSTAPPEPSKPRNAGEAARQELIRRGQYPNAASPSPRLVDTSDGNSGFAGTGIARRIALAASGGRGT